MATGKHLVPIDKVAYSLIKPDADLVLIDVRSLGYNHFFAARRHQHPQAGSDIAALWRYIKSADRIVLYSHEYECL